MENYEAFVYSLCLTPPMVVCTRFALQSKLDKWTEMLLKHRSVVSQTVGRDVSRIAQTHGFFCGMMKTDAGLRCIGHQRK